jgi:hypothetical protein
MNTIKSKLAEALKSVLPIAAIVLLLSVTLTPLSVGNMLLFIIGLVFLVLGMGLFNVGAEISMQPLGTKIGSSVINSGKIWLAAFVSFVIGIIVTISEPDLQILATQVPGVENMVLILTVSIGVGVFLMIALLRIVFGVSLRVILIIFYATAIVISFFLPESFRPLAFDSGGVTTGPMTVPFIMSLGAGVCSARGSKSGRDDSFGITALCSIGPIIAVLVLGIYANITGGEYTLTEIPSFDTTQSIAGHFGTELLHHAGEVAMALLPIVVFTVIFQLIAREFSKTQLIRIFIGIVYTFVGLSVFLTGANVGFMPIGTAIGETLAAVWQGYLLIPVGILLGFFIVKAEPAVCVLNRLVEEMSAGAISGKTTGLGLSIGVAAALGLASLRIVAEIPIMYILIPGYVIALALCFFVPKIFVGISFDSGGVASGAMMSGFVLPLAIGACTALGRDVMTYAFGCVALVAMAPIISIQLFGLLYTLKARRRKRSFISKSESFVEYELEERGVR